MTRKFCWLAAAAALAVSPLMAGPPAVSAQGCPPGQHEDTETPGFQCVPGWCPQGTLLDAVTGSCVTALGVPPPPLP
ncbi:MAG TPA: hypothetical protein PKK01_03640 [Mycobacterium sp.]|nr:MAG: hypothetical protein E6Q56_12320 [Mycobacterium sp.]HOB48392.1 hypothetical protein [Mycobacterium sp.]